MGGPTATVHPAVASDAGARPGAFPRAAGYEEAIRIVCYRTSLVDREAADV